MTNDKSDVDTSQTGQGLDNSKSSIVSSTVSVTNEDHLFVSNKLFMDLVALKHEFVNIMKLIDTAANSKVKNDDDIFVCSDIVCLPKEQINKGIKATNKIPLSDMFSQLITSVQPLCTPSFKLADKPCKTAIDIPSVEAFVGSKLDSMQDSFKQNLEDIQSKLSSLTGALDLQKRRLSGINMETSTPASRDTISRDTSKPNESVKLPPPEHDECHIDTTVEAFLQDEEANGLMEILSGDRFKFQSENGRSTLLFGEMYRYSGSQSEKPTDMPDEIKAIMDKLNQNRADDEGAPLNSCLINKFVGNASFINEHSDDEMSIDPKSKIYTITLGCPREILFRDLDTGLQSVHNAKPGSCYSMTRRSQNFFCHRIEPAEEESDLVRYSLTFRSVSWKNKNSTLLIGDSNTGMLRFGDEKGCFGTRLPGEKIYAPTLEDINPVSAVGYSNVIIMCGMNDIKSRFLTDKSDVDIIYDKFKLKIKAIKDICKGINIVVCPILPTRLPELNKKARYFNQKIFDDLVPNNWGVTYVWGFNEFLDETGYVQYQLSKDHIHLNRRGASILGSLIKRHFFPSPTRHFVDKRSYSQVASGGNVGTAGRRPAPPT